MWIEDDEGDRPLPPATGAEPLLPLSWGRGGLGARELARAILEHATGNPALATRLAREFTWDVVVGLPRDGFRLGGTDVLRWVASRD